MENKNTIHIWSKEQRVYLAEITPGRHYKEILELMNDKFEYQFTLQQIKNAIQRYKLKTGFDGRFQKGIIPWNKGTKGLTSAKINSFKKGNIPFNQREVGSERINVEGYTEVKIANPNKWELKHRLIWKEHNGEIPKGHTVIFADGDRSNLDINNLLLISRYQLLILNQEGLIKNDTELTKTGLNVANIIIKVNNIKKNKSKK
jgi:hypothetical protein